MLSHCKKVAMTYVFKKFTEKKKYLIFKININMMIKTAVAKGLI